MNENGSSKKNKKSRGQREIQDLFATASRDTICDLDFAFFNPPGDMADLEDSAFGRVADREKKKKKTVKKKKKGSEE